MAAMPGGSQGGRVTNDKFPSSCHSPTHALAEPRWLAAVPIVMLKEERRSGQVARKKFRCAALFRIYSVYALPEHVDAHGSICRKAQRIARLSNERETPMSIHTFILARTLAVCLLFAGMASVTRAEPLSSATPQASPVIVLAQQAGVPRGAKCLKWSPTGHRKMKCTQWCYGNGCDFGKSYR